MTETVLAVFAHPDDEALGCGGTLARHAKRGDTVHLLFLADGEGARIDSVREDGDVRRSASEQAADILGIQERAYLDWPDNRMDTVPLLDIVQSIEPHITRLAPDVIYTHFYNDLNIDHQITARAVMTACRPQPGTQTNLKRILAAEVLSSTEWALGTSFEPDYWIDITSTIDTKESSLKAYADEMREYPHTRSFQNVRQLAGVRGAAVGVAYAEAFKLLRAIER